MEVSIYVDGLSITPNPVRVNETFLIAVSVKDKIKSIVTADEKPLMTADGVYLKRSPEVAYGLMGTDDKYIKTADGNVLKIRKED